MSGTQAPKTFAEAEEVLARTLPGYESRVPQQRLAVAIEQAIASKKHLMAEAGCGTGKSLGYLIPAVLGPGRTVVSTATKALQDQVAGKDLPFLAEHLGVPVSFSVLKGRSNYLCQAKAVAPESEVSALPEILERIAEDDFDGERDSLGVDVTDAEWRALTTSSEECPGKAECPFGKVCFAEAAKAKAKESKVVVVNHALAFTDLVLRQIAPEASMLDAYDNIIFDEAHEAEEYAGSVVGATVTENSIKTLATQARNFAIREGLGEERQIDDLATALVARTEELWKTFTKAERIRQAMLLEHEDAWVGLNFAVLDLAEGLAGLSVEHVPSSEIKRVKARKQALVKRAWNLASKLQEIAAGDFAEVVRWIEETQTAKGVKRYVLRSAPINVGALLREWLFDREEEPVTAVLVSATMSANGSMSYLAGRLGIDEYDELDVGTPFDYAKQSVLYVPDDLPLPSGKDRAAWESASVNRMRELVMASNGRALLLFTSSKQMRTAHAMLSKILPFKCLVQGEKPNKQLAAEFAADTHSVLFATRSFFTGVDFQGETCSLVVIDKLPFPVPDEPLFEARCEAIEAKGGNKFSDYTMPLMSLVLKQGFGRLIRHRDDRGCVAILDPRLVVKPYGRRMMADLPPAKRVHSVDEVRAFFEQES